MISCVPARGPCEEEQQHDHRQHPQADGEKTHPEMHPSRGPERVRFQGRASSGLSPQDHCQDAQGRREEEQQKGGNRQGWIGANFGFQGQPD